VDVSGGSDSTGSNFVDEKQITISGSVNADTDNNGSGDTALNNITVKLFADTDGTAYPDDVSDSDGNANGTDYDTIKVDVSGGSDSTGNNFVDEKQITISGTVTADTDNDGTGDTNLNNITVKLYLDADGNGVADTPGTPTASTTSNASGAYSFTDVTAGKYVVVETDGTAYPDDVSDSDGNANGTDYDTIKVDVSGGSTSTGNDFVDKKAIDAVDDSGSTVNGVVGGESFANVLTNDTLNGAAVALADVNLTQESSTHAGVTLDTSDGSVDVAAGTPAGNYTLTYKICEKASPTHCDTATVTVPVITIDAVNDTGASVNSATGGESLANVLVNDTLQGAAVALANVNLTEVSSTHTGVTLDTSDGSVDVAAGTPAGTYTLTYKICEKSDPDNCDTAEVTVPVSSSSGADLSLSKVVDNPTASVGDYVKFTVTVKNAGPSDAGGVKVSDQLPSGYSYITSSPSQGSYDDATGVWTVGSISDGASASLTITVKVNATGDYKNVAQVTASNQNDPDSSVNNDDGDQSEDDEASAKIGYTNVFDPPSAWKEVDASGWPTTVWEQVWINNGNTTANPVRIVDPIPAGTTYINASLTCDARGSSTTTTCTYDATNNQIVWEGSIAADFGAQTETDANHEVVLTFSTTVPASMDQTENQAMAYWDQDGDGDIDNDDANFANNTPVLTDDRDTNADPDPTAARNPNKQVDLEVDVGISNANAGLGDTVTFTVALTNDSNGGAITDSATNITVEDIIPSGYTYVASSIGSSAGATGAAITADDSNEAQLKWNLDQLDPGETVTLSFQAKIDGVGDFKNIAQVTAQDQPDMDSSPDNDDGDQSEDDEDRASIVTAELGNYVWIDDSPHNGLQDEGEDPCPDVIVHLYGDLNGDGVVSPFGADGGAIGSQENGADGSYSFTVAPGTYLVEFMLPDGYNFTTQNAGDDGLDSDVSQLQPASIGDKIWLDDNKDGIQDGSEIGYQNVTVNLFTDLDADGSVEPYADDGNPVQTTITDSSGAYEFVVNPGLYKIEAIAPNGWAFSEPDAGADDVDSDFVDDNAITGGDVEFVGDFYDPVFLGINQGSSNSGFSPDIGIDFNTSITHIDGGLMWLALGDADTARKAMLDIATEPNVSDNKTTLVFGKMAMPIQNSIIMQVVNNLQASGRTSTVTLNAGDSDQTLDVGVIYTGTSSGTNVTDNLAGNDLDEDLVDALPNTGFAPSKETILEPSSDGFGSYTEYDQLMTLEIPSLEVNEVIVGVPLINEDWDTTWLWSEIGYLEGTAFPTTVGNTALSAHAYLPSGEPGPFVDLDQLSWGNLMIIDSGDLVYIYQVRERTFVAPDDLSALRSESEDWVTLITCYQYDEELGEYLWRVVVRAVLIDIVAK